MNQNSKKTVERTDVKVSGLGKIPPQAIELEEAVLGAILTEKNAIFIVSEILRPDDFYHEKHQIIYHCILELSDKSDPIDILTVTQKLRTKGQLEFVGGAYYVTCLTNKVNSAASIENHARSIFEYSLKRQLLLLCSEVVNKCYNDTEDAFMCKQLMDSGLSRMNAGIDSGHIKSMKDVITSALTQVSSAMKIADGITGVPSGFSGIDKITAGWQKTDLIIIAARPGMGKTAFVVCNALNSAIRFKKPGAIFSLEMSSEQLGLRMMASELDYLDLSTDKLRRGKITEEEYSQIHKNINELIESEIFIDDTPALSLSKLRSKSYHLKRKHNIEWIIVDYLQLMTADLAKGALREQEISTISRGLKNLAKELKIPIIALSQLSRAVETRGGDKRPMLSDLRESGAIEQDADLIAFLYRPEYYGISEDKNGFPTTGVGEFIISKHRNGSIEDVILKFVGKKTKFYDPSQRNNEPSSAQNFTYRAPYKDDDNIKNFESGAKVDDDIAPF